ncbi:MAG TPA: maltose ABC transporter permease MalF [Ideonella sp.]|uniref:maltose ABC transporter permease MalF n=1 Tax=Ideonella sp. TaxID=1929293 RepID=UPI002E328EAB|nr:maltose ABC transporter permease MalF [Ideonella sp.]HEX5682390.1 maltose ABC transporter permease MalF [Ideonella sp.]
MNTLAASPPLTRPASAGQRSFTWAIAALCELLVLWFAWRLAAGGQVLVSTAALALGTMGVWTYASTKSLAWRYLFPGVAGMLVFVAFPLVYTMQIGFTNYSSAHLLSEARARAYLLDQNDVDEARAMASSLHADGSALRIKLTSADGSEVLVTPPLPQGAAPKAPVALSPATQDLGTPLSLREVLAQRDTLRDLVLQRPDGTRLHYTGVREFGPLMPLWKAGGDGALVQQPSGTVYKPNRDTGYFENERGEHIQPGFKVNIGWANYTRMMFDADFRGPFVSIFGWTVVFSALTVLFATIIGMTLAVLLNWEALKYRTLYRTLLFLPYAVPGFISILVFKGLFNQNFGEINAILDALFGVRPAWFADPTLARAMLLIVNTWLGYPYVMVLCTGLLKAIPADLYEASAIAGAGPLTNFFKITAPLIAKPLTPLLISAFAFNFNNFVLIALLTDGRPDYLNTKLPAGTTDILVSYTYRIAFTDAGANFGLAAAISTLIFIVVALMSLVNLKLTGEAKAARN